MTNEKIVAISGGFDPIHIGHVRLIQEAAKLGTKLVVILNNDVWLEDKKGAPFMPLAERMEILMGMKGVDAVIPTSHKPGFTDRSVCYELYQIKPDIFANGGDRFSDNVPEKQLCIDLGIEMVFNVGHGGKVQSSSWLIEKANKEALSGPPDQEDADVF